MKESGLTVFFDGGCPLCSREIAHYRRLKPLGLIDWIDVSMPNVDLTAYGIDQEQAMRRFHVLDSQGCLHTGAGGFVALWTQLPGYRWISRVAINFGLVRLMDRFYQKFADWHFRQRCDEGACGLRDDSDR